MFTALFPQRTKSDLLDYKVSSVYFQRVEDCSCIKKLSLSPKNVFIAGHLAKVGILLPSTSSWLVSASIKKMWYKRIVIKEISNAIFFETSPSLNSPNFACNFKNSLRLSRMDPKTLVQLDYRTQCHVSKYISRKL